VPDEFMKWGNQFSRGSNIQPSRLIIKTKDPGSPELVNYLEKNGYTTDADKTRFSKYRKIVNTVAAISWVSGAIMLAFALLVFTLFIQLTITACKTEIELLVTLGASPKQLKLFLIKQFFPPNVFIVFVSLVVISLLQYFTAQWLGKINMFVSSYTSIYTVAVAILLLIVLWLVNVRTIGKYVKS
jgi:cell division protein FtsX